MAVTVYHFESAAEAEAWSLGQTLLCQFDSAFGFEDASPYIAKFGSRVAVEELIRADATSEEEFWSVRDQPRVFR